MAALRDELEQAHGAATEFSSIPVIDMQPFVSWWRATEQPQPGGAGAEAEAALAAAAAVTAEQVGRACREVGFLVLVGTGIPDGLMDGAMSAAQRFLTAPAEHKASASSGAGHPSAAASRCYRGYEAMEGKEAWEMGRELPEEPESLPLHGPNRWPAADAHGGAAFRQTMEAYYAAVVSFARCLLGALCLSLGLPPRLMQGATGASLAHLRMWRYAQASAEGSLPEHTDHGFLTLLLQDGGGGLQARNRAGEWVGVPPQPHSLVINSGRLLSRWTNNAFPATFHRVLNNSSADRFSVPLFFGTNYETVISPLDCCFEAASAAAAPGSVVCGEYIAEGYAWQGAVNAGEATAADAAAEAGADYDEHGGGG